MLATRHPLRRAAILIVLVALAALTAAAQPARAAEAFFPDLAPATQISRDLTLQQAAQSGLISLQSKGGGVGDAVSLELKAKKVRGPITITLHVEFTVKPRVSSENREGIANLVPDLATATEAELNRTPYRSKSGDPIRFKLDWRYREPEAPELRNYHQVLIINPRVDLDEPDPGYRSSVDQLGVPNKLGASSGTFSTGDLKAIVLAHESLHLIGLDDRYVDVYRVGGKDYPLPQSGMSPSQLEQFRLSHVPPLPARGIVRSAGTPGTGRCDIMGPGFESACRKISRRDLDWLDQQAGVQVIAQPGDLLLNKKPDRQNLGVGFRTTVFASPGSTTVANGIAVYCIDHDKSFPLDEGFDVGPAGGELPGYEGIVKLLQLNATLQPGLNDTVDGMQAAIWNLTDASPLATSGTADASRALLAQAGVAEDSVPGGLPPIADPNADAIETGTVGASGEVMPTTPAVAIEPPPPVRVDTAQLFPAQLRAGRGLRGDLLVGANGDVKQLDVRIERGTGRRWTRVRSLARRPLEAGLTPVTLSLGTLRAGRYRLVVSVSGSLGTPAVARAAFTVR